MSDIPETPGELPFGGPETAGVQGPGIVGAALPPPSSDVGDRVLELVEYQERRFDSCRISNAAGNYLYVKHGSKISIEPPSFKTDYKWTLTCNGWVGFLPVDDTLALALRPKVPLSSLFRMLDYAYDIRLEAPKGQFDADSLESYCETLASMLAKRVLMRAQAGLYRTYLAQEERLPYLRGKLQVDRVLRRPWDVELQCEFHEHTADVEENRILAWTLFLICRSGVCSDRVQPTVRRAFRILQGACRVEPVASATCLARIYSRLNQDYEPMHALCRFFLDHLMPTHEIGDRRMLPFLVDMSALYEKFVAAWLGQHLPPHFDLSVQHTVPLDGKGIIQFKMDLVIRDAETGKALFVLDTKYKAAPSPSTDDIQQVVAYATSLGCSHAALVYPRQLGQPMSTSVGAVNVRTMTFALDSDLEQSGQDFLAKVIHVVGHGAER